MNTQNILLHSNSWAEFTSQVRKLNRKNKGDCFESLTEYYLQLHPNYATKLESVWPLRRVPPTISKHLNLPGPDEGIDLVAKTKEGDYWAIQCKFRDDETKSLSRRELSTFTDLTFGICNNFQLALVCTTADRFSRKLGLYRGRVSFLCGDKWRELDEEFFQRLHALIRGKFVLPKPRKPRSHQEKAIRNALSYFIENRNERGKLIMPCATGKTLAAYWIANELRARSILIAVPSLALIRGTLEVWARESLANHEDIQWICVCSDTTIAEARDEDIAVLSQDLGIQIHTNTDQIADWLNKNHGSRKVVINTYQSGRALSEAASKVGFEFDLGIMDEAHKTVGKRHSLFSHLLHDQNVKIKKRIFMTATERRYLGRSDEIASMEDPELYGETFELLTFKTALETDPPILSDYKIVPIMVCRSEIAEIIKKNLFVRPDKGSWDEDVEAEMLAAAIALRKAMLKHPIKHAISFHSSVARARAFKNTQDILTDTFPEFGELQTFHVSGSMPTSVRERELGIFDTTSRGLITNARCLTEGVDVPNIDCVLFADPKRSIIDIVQAVGRALRPASGKELAYVIIPFLADDNANTGSLLESGAFDAVLTTIRALGANDERIIEYFRSVSQGRRYNQDRISFSIELPLSMGINAEEFIESIELKLWSRLAKLSWIPFSEARAYVRTLGLKNNKGWRAFCRGELPHRGTRPNDIPVNPDRVYKNKGWITWGDWLGTGKVSARLWEHRPFESARTYAHTLGLKSKNEWDAFCRGKLPHLGKLPKDIPRAPGVTYAKEGWIGWGDWLGTGSVANYRRKYRQFELARAYVQPLALKNAREWEDFCHGKLPDKGTRPDDIPANPQRTYRNKDWISWGDWLGTVTVALRGRKYRLFEPARAYVHTLGLKSRNEWNEFCRGESPHLGELPEDIPKAPHYIYRNKGWISMGDWLGTGTVAPQLKKYRPFEQSRTYIRSLGLKNNREWRAFCKRELPHLSTLPEDIPANPNQVYRQKGWISWGDWMGTVDIAASKTIPPI